MTKTIKTALALLFACASMAPIAALAQPVLKKTVVVSSAIVTVGDMFTNAGLHAERGLFRAPAPGKSGDVSIEAVRAAAKRVGISEFAHAEIPSVNVAREGVAIGEDGLKELIVSDLRRRGIVSGEVLAEIAFSSQIPLSYAAPGDNPVSLIGLRYSPGSGGFSAQFQFAGYESLIDVHGRLDLMIEAPHLRQSLPAGAIISLNDIEMRAVQLSFAENGGLSTPEQLIGKALKRPARAGMMLRASDVAEPEVIKRSDTVTLFYNHGPMRLTAKGQALNAASIGGSVAVLNLVSKKIVHGVAADFGTVEMIDPMLARASSKS